MKTNTRRKTMEIIIGLTVLLTILLTLLVGFANFMWALCPEDWKNEKAKGKTLWSALRTKQETTPKEWEKWTTYKVVVFNSDGTEKK
jgi:hypothetical protein